MSKNKEEPVNTGRKQDGTFIKGSSGNPAGKPKGARNKHAMLIDNMLESDTEELTRKVIEMAKGGDMTAMRICMDRLLPPLKSTSPKIHLDIDPPTNMTDLVKAFLAATVEGQLAPDLCAQLVQATAGAMKVEEQELIKQRLDAIETAMKGRA
jgi:hypothetical protein